MKSERNSKLISSINTNLYLFQLMELLSEYEHTVYSELGITRPQLFVMAAIKYLKPPVFTTDIARWLNLSMNAVNATMNIMVREGMVKRTRSLKDRRNVRLTLTAKSEELFVKASACFRDIPITTMSPLTIKELQSMTDLSQKLIKHLLSILVFDGSFLKLVSYHRVEAVQNILKQEHINYSVSDFYQFLSSQEPVKLKNKRSN
jgi:DNA-binding MarR family transcriptional regulator